MPLTLFEIEKRYNISLLNKNILHMPNMGVSDKDVAIILKFCKEKEITELNLGCNNVTDKGVKELCDSKLFKNLNLSYNRITKKSLEYLKENDMTYDISLNHFEY
jgi:hypothetical protein